MGKTPAPGPAARSPLPSALQVCLWSLLLCVPLVEAGEAPICASGNVTVLGADLAAGEILLAPSGRPGDLIVLDVGAEEAVLVPGGWAGSIRGGSVASGPVVAAQPCGASCLKVVRWRDGAWRQLGEALVADPRAGLVETTYDLSGIPWILFRRAAEDGWSHVAAYRARGREWIPHGGGQVTAVGSPFASPSRSSLRAVVAGDVEIRAERGPSRELRDPPLGVELAGAQLYRLPDGRPLLLTPRGDLYERREDGSGWRPVRWRPWGAVAEGGDGMGSRHLVEILPDAGSADATGAVWTDVDADRLFLVEWQKGKGWTTLLETRDGMRTRGGDRLPFRQILRLRDGRWVLLSGCVEGPAGASLAYVVLAGGRLGAPKVLPVRTR